MGRNDGRGMQSLLIGENLYFLPPPLNKGLATLICSNRDLVFDDMFEKFFDTKYEFNDDILLRKAKLESLPTYRLFSSIIQSGLYYPVDLIA